jgi:hypothetical protein
MRSNEMTASTTRPSNLARWLGSAIRPAASIDQFGGRRHQYARNSETQSLRGFKVDDKLELTRSLNRQVCGLRTFEDLSDIVGPEPVGNVE